MVVSMQKKVRPLNRDHHTTSRRWTLVTGVALCSIPLLHSQDVPGIFRSVELAGQKAEVSRPSCHCLQHRWEMACVLQSRVRLHTLSCVGGCRNPNLVLEESRRDSLDEGRASHVNLWVSGWRPR